MLAANCPTSPSGHYHSKHMGEEDLKRCQCCATTLAASRCPWGWQSCRPAIPLHTCVLSRACHPQPAACAMTASVSSSCCSVIGFSWLPAAAAGEAAGGSAGPRAGELGALSAALPLLAPPPAPSTDMDVASPCKWDQISVAQPTMQAMCRASRTFEQLQEQLVTNNGRQAGLVVHNSIKAHLVSRRRLHDDGLAHCDGQVPELCQHGSICAMHTISLNTAADAGPRQPHHVCRCSSARGQPCRVPQVPMHCAGMRSPCCCRLLLKSSCRALVSTMAHSSPRMAARTAPRSIVGATGAETGNSSAAMTCSDIRSMR